MVYRRDPCGTHSMDLMYLCTEASLNSTELGMDQGTLLFDGQMLILNEDSHQGPPQVARVTAFQWRVIQPRFRSSTEVQQM